MNPYLHPHDFQLQHLHLNSLILNSMLLSHHRVENRIEREAVWIERALSHLLCKSIVWTIHGSGHGHGPVGGSRYGLRGNVREVIILVFFRKRESIMLRGKARYTERSIWSSGMGYGR